MVFYASYILTRNEQIYLIKETSENVSYYK